MSDRRPYTYVLLRYRHDPLAGEFVNVGVVLHAPADGYLDAKVRTAIGARLQRMFPGADRDSVVNGLNVIARGLRKMNERGEGSDLLYRQADAEAFARRALPHDDSSFVWGPLGAGLSADPARTLIKLYERFIARHDEEERPRSARDDAAVWRPVRDKLVSRQIAHLLESKVIRAPTDEVKFEHAWKNGAWHVCQPVSLDLASAENIRDKAARWLGHLSALQRSTETFIPHILTGRPSDPALHDDYRRALETLRLTPGRVDVIDEAETDRLVDQIETDLLAHSAGRQP